MSRILIIEDQPDIRRLIRWALEPECHQIFEASNGERGLATAQIVQPDLIILDVMMPGELDGFQVCQRLKANPELAQRPVVMLTALARERDRDAGERAGADAYLPKPFSPIELIRIVTGLLIDAKKAPEPKV